MYIMDLVFIDSQKSRFNLTQLAKKVGVTVTNVRNRHERVTEILFQKLWDYMTLPFSEMLERLRGEKTIPKKLLCLDPGKTTGWCVFENGKLSKGGHVENCYNDDGIQTSDLFQLIEDVDPDFIVYEDYKVYANKLQQHSFSPVNTLRLIGGIESFCQTMQILKHKQMATTAKNFVTDDKLKQWGYWQPGLKHARDAVRHGCYFLLFYRRGQNII